MSSIDVGADGHIIVAHPHHCLTKLSIGGDLRAKIGCGSAGWVDGPAETAKFCYPAAVAFGHDGQVWVADAENHAVRKVSVDGQVSTVAGCGEDGFVDGIRGLARFNGPLGISVDLQGCAFIADTENSAVRKVDPTGEVVTFCGPRPRGNGGSNVMGPIDQECRKLHEVWRVAASIDGTVWAASHDRLWQITTTGRAVEVEELLDMWDKQRLTKIFDISSDSYGRCWVTTGKRVCALSPGGSIVFTQLFPAFIASIALDTFGNFYVAAGNGVQLWERHRSPKLQVEFMQQLVEPNELADVSIVVGQEQTRILAHRFVLTSRSDYFDRMLRSNFQEGGNSDIVLRHVSYSVLKTIFVFLYTGIVDIVEENLLDVAAKADEYQLGDLLQECKWFCERELRVDNVVVWLMEAERLKLEFFRSTCLKFVVANAAKIVENQPDTIMTLDPLCRDLVLGLAGKVVQCDA